MAAPAGMVAGSFSGLEEAMPRRQLLASSGWGSRHQGAGDRRSHGQLLPPS